MATPIGERFLSEKRAGGAVRVGYHLRRPGGPGNRAAEHLKEDP